MTAESDWNIGWWILSARTFLSYQNQHICCPWCANMKTFLSEMIMQKKMIEIICELKVKFPVSVNGLQTVSYSVLSVWSLNVTQEIKITAVRSVKNSFVRISWNFNSLKSAEVTEAVLQRETTNWLMPRGVLLLSVLYFLYSRVIISFLSSLCWCFVPCSVESVQLYRVQVRFLSR